MKLDVLNVMEMIVEIAESKISDESERKFFYEGFILEFEGVGVDFKKIYDKSEDIVFDEVYETIHPELNDADDAEEENKFWFGDDF